MTPKKGKGKLKVVDDFDHAHFPPAPLSQFKFDRRKFRDEYRQRRYEIIKTWSFIRERRVNLLESQYPTFTTTIDHHRWAVLTEPCEKFDSNVVLEFYANAWPNEDGQEVDKRSWVRGKWVPYTREAINQLLGNPLTLQPGQRCAYSERRGQRTGFDDNEVAQLLCVPWGTYEVGTSNAPVRILRRNMKELTKIWMSFLLSNVMPSDHNSDLNMPKSYLVYSIIQRIQVDIAWVISNALRQFIIAEPSRNRDNPKKALGFPALITALCAAHGVPNINPSQKIRPSIDQRFVQKFCCEEGGPAEGGAQEHPELPPPPPQHAAEMSYAAYFQKLDLQQQHIMAQLASHHRGQVQLNHHFHHYTQHLHSQVPDPYAWPSPEQFAALVSWPGDRPIFPEGSGPSGGQQAGGEQSGIHDQGSRRRNMMMNER